MADTAADSQDSVSSSATVPTRYNDRPRYLTYPKPVGDVWQELETSLWDLGASHNARPQAYQIGKDDGDRRMGPGANLTFKIPSRLQIGQEQVKVLFGKDGTLKDAPASIKDIARRAPVWVLAESDYYQRHDPEEHVHLMRIWLHAIGMNGFLPNRLSRGVIRRQNKAQLRKRQDGTLLNRSFVWSQTISPKAGVIQLTGWTVMGVGDLDHPEREFNDGGVMVFPPLRVRVGGKDRTLSIVQILTKLVFGTNWFFGAILDYVRAVNPEQFSPERMKLEESEPDDEEVHEWAIEHRKSASRPLGASIGDAAAKNKRPAEKPAISVVAPVAAAPIVPAPPQAPVEEAKAETEADSEPVAEEKKPNKRETAKQRHAREQAEVAKRNALPVGD